MNTSAIPGILPLIWWSMNTVVKFLKSRKKVIEIADNLDVRWSFNGRDRVHAAVGCPNELSDAAN
jgi:hypothetical protein